MILGIGTDIVNIARIERLWKEYGSSFVKKILHNEEEKRFEGLSQVKKASYLAKRFCAKEAFVKSVGTGFDHKIFLRDISIPNDKRGKPYYSINNKVDKYIKEVFLVKEYRVHLSLSDDIGYASAVSIIEKA